MPRPATARSHVLPFNTAHWHARERAKKRLEQLLGEMRAIEAWLELQEAGDARPGPPAKSASELRLCK